MGHSIRLHLGAGDRSWPGWINVDCIGDQDLISDVTKLDLPDDHADEISAIHLFEHIPTPKAQQTLLEWLRVLKPGGQLSLEMPCLDNVIALWNQGHRNDDLIGRALFGMPEPDTMRHHWCYSKQQIGTMLVEAGFENVRFEEPFFHLPQRDLRVVGSKSKE
jgi:predicted SAM-dependent methyltransferase